MSKHYDVVVIGLGAHGSSALYHLAKETRNVCGIDKFTPPHDFGSSHGQSRIIRQAYYEHPMYVPLVKRAYEKWEELEVVSGQKLFLKTGGLMLGAAGSRLVEGAKISAEMHGIPYEQLDHPAVTKRFPVFRTGDSTVGVIEKNAGILFPEKCIGTYLAEAEKIGAEIKLNEQVLGLETENHKVNIITSKHTYSAAKVVVCAGAWVKDLLPRVNLPLTVERQVLFWFRNKNSKNDPRLSAEQTPIFIWEYQQGKMFYGFPDLGDGMKIAFHHSGREIKPADLKHDVSQEEIAAIHSIAKQYLSIDPEYNYSTTCMYTNTPDEHFILDFHPSNKNIIIASPCSGHGFKFASYTGFLLAAMALGRTPDTDITPFRLDRFSSQDSRSLTIS